MKCYACVNHHAISQITTHDLRVRWGNEELHQKDEFETKEMEHCWWIGTFGLIDHLSICTASRTLIEENMQNE